MVDLGEVEESDPVDLLDRVDGNVALQKPGDLLKTGGGAEVPCQDVLEVKWDVFP